MPRYDFTRYDPPAPVALVGLRDIGSLIIPDLNVPLLIDSGADVTLLPRSALRNFRLTPSEPQQFELIGFDGSRSKVDSVELEMIFLNKSFAGRYLLSDGDHGILGRDVLANIKLLLDGPLNEWSTL